MHVCRGQVVGGPASNTRALGKGDVILEVDAVSIDNESLHDALVGSDVAGSTVTVRVRKAGSGEIQDVEVVRIDSRELADKRRLFELFTDIENYIGELLWFGVRMPCFVLAVLSVLPHGSRARELAAPATLCSCRWL